MAAIKLTEFLMYSSCYTELTEPDFYHWLFDRSGISSPRYVIYQVIELKPWKTFSVT